jgi:hypothetical protein
MNLSAPITRFNRVPRYVRRLATPAISEFRRKLAEGPSLADFVSDHSDRIVLGNTKG